MTDDAKSPTPNPSSVAPVPAGEELASSPPSISPSRSVLPKPVARFIKAAKAGYQSGPYVPVRSSSPVNSADLQQLAAPAEEHPQSSERTEPVAEHTFSENRDDLPQLARNEIFEERTLDYREEDSVQTNDQRRRIKTHSARHKISKRGAGDGGLLASILQSLVQGLNSIPVVNRYVSTSNQLFGRTCENQLTYIATLKGFVRLPKRSQQCSRGIDHLW